MNETTDAPKTFLKNPTWWVFLGVAALALALDLLTKAWALSNLVEGEKRDLVGSFISLQLIYNPGAAFSLGSGATWIFTILSAAIIVLIVWYAARSHSVVLAILLGLIAGGAAGNLFDRLTRPPGFGTGYVVDFLNYNDWFIGNVADIWIVGAAIALVLWKLFTPESDRAGEVDSTQVESADE